MARLRGHATDPPGRWKEPRAFAAADHAAQRARQGRGRRPIRRRVRGQCGERRRRGGKSDPSRGRDTRAGDRDDRGGLRDCGDGAGARRGRESRRAAVRHADEQYAWPRSHDAQIAKRRLQRRQVFWRSGVSTTSERQRASTGHGASNRGTRETTGSVRRSIEAVTEGLEVSAPGPHLIRRSAQPTRPPRARSNPEAMDADAPVDAQNAPTAAWKSRWRTRDSHKRPQPFSFSFQRRKTKNNYDDCPDLRGFR